MEKHSHGWSGRGHTVARRFTEEGTSETVRGAPCRVRLPNVSGEDPAESFNVKSVEAEALPSVVIN